MISELEIQFHFLLCCVISEEEKEFKVQIKTQSFSFSLPIPVKNKMHSIPSSISIKFEGEKKENPTASLNSTHKKTNFLKKLRRLHQILPCNCNVALNSNAENEGFDPTVVLLLLLGVINPIDDERIRVWTPRS